jgi:hypothetical protein
MMLPIMGSLLTIIFNLSGIHTVNRALKLWTPATGQHFDETTRQPTKPKLPPLKLNLSSGDSDYAPWAPFPTESDFDFAEQVATSHMTESDITKELNFWLQKAISTEEALKMHTQTVHDIQKYIQSAIDMHTKVDL